MDPELMKITCLCPDCVVGVIGTGFDDKTYLGCPRCGPYGGMGYVPCETLLADEAQRTMPDERSLVIVDLGETGEIHIEVNPWWDGLR